MKVRDQYTLPLKSIQEGTRIYEFELTKDFFQSIDNQLIGECSIQQQVLVEKRSELIILHFSHSGFMQTACDRCLEPIQIPISGSRQFILKFVEEEQEEDEDVIYVLRDEDKFDMVPLINEIITLTVPLIKVYDCEEEENAPCNQDVLKYLDRVKPKDQESQIWDQLKNLKLED